MNDSKSKLAESCLAKPDIHRQWYASRVDENESFFDEAFDYIVRVLKPPPNSVFLDVGCGICDHAIRLANRGFLVKAVDFSEYVLKEAEARIKAQGLETKIGIQREDILALSFEDKTFNYILCWGVLMHIPDLEKAIEELTRVLKPLGTLVISEGNMYSLQSMTLRNLIRFLGKEKDDVKKTPAGVERYTITSAGLLLVRHANIQWLMKKFNSNRLTVRKHIAGQFTEIGTVASSRLLRNLVHGFNKFWFRYIKMPHLAFGNILILQKKE